MTNRFITSCSEVSIPVFIFVLDAVPLVAEFDAALPAELIFFESAPLFPQATSPSAMTPVINNDKIFFPFPIIVSPPFSKIILNNTPLSL